VVVRSDNTTVDDSSSTGNVWWDGEWNGHPWWFRPTWDHPVTDTADWVQWGTDRRAGIVWRWQDNSWQRIGRPTNDPPNRPWLPAVIGPGRLDHNPAPVPLNQQPPQNQQPPGAPNQVPVPGQPQVPQVAPQATASVQPGVTAPQQITRPGFRDTQPGNTTGQPGTTPGAPSSSAPTPAPKSDQQPARVGTESGSAGDATRGNTSSTTTGTGSDSSTTENNRTTEGRTGTNDSTASTPTPAPKPDRTDNTRDHSDRSGDTSGSVGVQGGANSTGNHRTTGDQS
jgi:hypothetical protein